MACPCSITQMENVLSFVLVGAVFLIRHASSGFTYNSDAKEDSKFSCYSDMDTLYRSASDSRRIKLYLGADSLKIHCYLYDTNEDSLENRKKLLLLYTTVGLAPSIRIFNSTFSGVFFFQMKLVTNQSSWFIDIPRSNITYNTDVASIEEWYVQFKMHHGLNMFVTEGTILDSLREPLLQWALGSIVSNTAIEDFMPYVINITIAKNPCAGDVALIGPIFQDNMQTGIILGVTSAGFLSQDTVWYNVTPSLCDMFTDDCSQLALVNVILTNYRIALLTTLGLFISADLTEKGDSVLKFKRSNFCGFDEDDYYNARIWYAVQCLANKEHFEADYLSLAFNKDKTLSQVSTCFFSTDPYDSWYSCLPFLPQYARTVSKRVVTFLVDSQQNTGIGLLKVQNQALVSVNNISSLMSKKPKFPIFLFPDADFIPLGMFFQPGTHFLYAYGSQLWLSNDGGNTFVRIISLQNETFTKVVACSYSQSIALATNNGNIYFTKSGLEQYARLGSSDMSVFSLYCDHVGSLALISLTNTTLDRVFMKSLDTHTIMQEDDQGFEFPLAPQYITEQEVWFFQHSLSSTNKSVTSSQRFNNLHIGKVIKMGDGSGIINNILHLTSSPGFQSVAVVHILDRFPIESKVISPCLLNTISFSPATRSTFTVLLQNVGRPNKFQSSDIGKTIVIPGYSSFLITEIQSSISALADATMPIRVPLNQSFSQLTWYMYDFSTNNNHRHWKIRVDDCRYTIQQLDDLPPSAIVYLDIKSKATFTFRVSAINTAFPIFQMKYMTLIVGNPSMVSASAKHYWDDTDRQTMLVTATKMFNEEGRSSISVVVGRASILCAVSSLTIILKSSCSYRKSMHYQYPVTLTSQDWLKGDPKDSNGNPMLQSLPFNYRPPSKRGIAVPLTNNIYNADPSKPKFRDYFHESKVSGVYKKCFGMKSRIECNCTDNEKLSFFAAYSDCREKVLRMKFPVKKLPIQLYLLSENEYSAMRSPYFVTVTEVNNRDNWEVTGTNSTPSMLKLRQYLRHKSNSTLYNPEGLLMSIYGSELFHFRISLIPGVSFCELADEFQIYVVDAPMAFPGQYLIKTLTSVLLGGVILVAFFMKRHNVQIWGTVRKIIKKRGKVSPVS